MTEEIKDETYFRLKEEYLSELQHLKEKCFAIEQESIQKSQMICELEQENKQMKSALEEIKDLCIHYENTNDKCVTNCYAHFIVTDLIQDKINEVLQ